MPGPAKTPTELKVIAGTDRADRQDPEAAKFEQVREFPPAPQHLNPDGQAMWIQLGNQLVACGILQIVDLYALEQLCYCWQQHRQKAKAGMPVTASEDNALKGLLAEFGLTPSARRRVVANLKEAPPANRFAQHGKRPT